MWIFFYIYIYIRDENHHLIKKQTKPKSNDLKTKFTGKKKKKKPLTGRTKTPKQNKHESTTYIVYHHFIFKCRLRIRTRVSINTYVGPIFLFSDFNSNFKNS